MIIEKRQCTFFLLAACILFCVFPASNFVINGYLIVLLFAALCLLYERKIRIQRALFPASSLVYAFTFVVSYLYHFTGNVSISNIVGFIVYFFVVPITIASVLRSKQDFENILQKLLYFALAYALLGFIEAFSGLNVFDIIFNRSITVMGANSLRLGLHRSYGVMTVSINNAMFVSMLWMLCSYKRISSQDEKKINKIIWLALAIYVYLILSRTIILVATGAQIILFLLNNKIKIRKRNLMIFPAVGLIALAFKKKILSVIDSLKSIFMPLLIELATGENAYGGSGQRKQLFSWVMQSMDQKYAFGVGYKTKFSYGYIDQNSLGEKFSRVKESIENTFLYIFYRKGIFGVFGFVSYLLGILLQIMQYKRKYKKDVFNETFSLIFIIYLISAFTFSANEELRFFYVLVALFRIYNNT